MNEPLTFFNTDACTVLSLAWNGLRHPPWARFSRVTLKLVFWLVFWWYILIQSGSRSMCNSELSNTEKSTGLVVMMPMGSCEQYLCVAHSQRLFQFLPALLDLKEKEKLYSSSRFNCSVAGRFIYKPAVWIIPSYLAVEISAHSLLRPWLVIKFSSAFFLWVSDYISHHLRQK